MLVLYCFACVPSGVDLFYKGKTLFVLGRLHNLADRMRVTGLLEGKRILIFGVLDEKSLAWRVAQRVHEAGARVALTNTPVALRVGRVGQLAEKLSAPLIPADATSTDDLEKLLKETIERLGGPLDGVLHSVAMSFNIRRKNPYYALDYQLMLKTLDVSALSLHKLLQTAWKLDALSEWASVVTLSYVAAQRVFPGYNEMAEAKALLESIVRHFGYWYGRRRKVRINAVSQSPVPTTAGSSVPGFAEFYEYAQRMSPLGNADADDCALLCVALFSDLTRKVTMQTIFNDGGFAFMGVSEELIEVFNRGLKG